MKKLIPVLFFLALFASACGVNPVSQPPQAILPTMDTVSYPTVQASQPVANQAVSGFNVSLQRAWRDGKTIYADVCFALPDESDWTIWSAHFDFGGQSVTDFSTSLMSTQAASKGQPGKRCDQVGLPRPALPCPDLICQTKSST